jgi:hypothetical protein
MLQRFILFGLIVIAQPCWAIAVLNDTLIIDGEVIYIEERSQGGADSLIHAKQSDFKKSAESLPWAVECVGFGSSVKSAWSYSPNDNFLSLQKFIGKKQNDFGFGARLSFFTQIHKHIHVGLGLDYYQFNTQLYSVNPLNSESTIAFFLGDNQEVNQVVQVEIQPGAYETDTVQLITTSNQWQIQQWAIPLHFRFYVNAYSQRQNWRAFGQISPTIYFHRHSVDSPVIQSFLNENGQFLNAVIQNKTDVLGSVQIKLGIERRLSKHLQCHAGLNFQFPPLVSEHAGNTRVSFNTRNVDFGLRWSIGKWKD